MRVLVACEVSGIVREAFRARGHEAVSCDLTPSEQPGPHYTGDVGDLLGEDWDLLIAHPPCTYLANSGVRWLSEDVDRWAHLETACQFFNQLWAATIPRSCVENPIPHKHAVQRLIGGRPMQIIQPWQFGHGETKATGLWLKGLPWLVPTEVVAGREPRIHRLSPGPDRARLRSRTYPGIGEAMAAQWGRARYDHLAYRQPALWEHGIDGYVSNTPDLSTP